VAKRNKGDVSAAEGGRRIVARNRRARHDYEILDTYEAGLALRGSEVKSIREGNVSLAEAFVGIDRRGEAWIHGMHVAEYPWARDGGHEPMRPRKLLLSRSELDHLAGKQREAGLSIVPLSLYFIHGLAKLEIALARGKKLYDKREATRRRDTERELRREVGRRAKGMSR